MFLHLAGIFVILYIILQKLFASRDCPPQLFITTCGTMCSLKYTANTGDFIFDLHTKFLKNFRAAKKRNIFSRPGYCIPCLYIFWHFTFYQKFLVQNYIAYNHIAYLRREHSRRFGIPVKITLFQIYFQLKQLAYVPFKCICQT